MDSLFQFAELSRLRANARCSIINERFNPAGLRLFVAASRSGLGCESAYCFRIDDETNEWREFEFVELIILGNCGEALMCRILDTHDFDLQRYDFSLTRLKSKII